MDETGLPRRRVSMYACVFTMTRNVKMHVRRGTKQNHVEAEHHEYASVRTCVYVCKRVNATRYCGYEERCAPHVAQIVEVAGVHTPGSPH